ncbi:type II toxin-antitoxin system RelE/ParE family toxin [Arcobacter aquimarinus]|uniref:type II toxin-antitoxin system RelE/ParE family toxin n=1 Tax=Arcobacter aquimarinus TaxID=1315211 RepID=UPI003BAF37C9
MYQIRQTNQFSSWLSKLKDVKEKVSIFRRIDRIRKGNFGDYKSVGGNIFELRFTIGPAYRVYYTKVEDEIILLLIAGDKSTQSEDIKKAKELAKEYSNEK